MRIERKRCCIQDCKSDNESEPNETFHKFSRKPEVLQQWFKNINDPVLLLIPPSKLWRSYYICGKHFETNQFQTPLRQRLNRGAVPTLFDYGPLASMDPNVLEIVYSEEDVPSNNPDDERLILFWRSLRRGLAEPQSSAEHTLSIAVLEGLAATGEMEALNGFVFQGLLSPVFTPFNNDEDRTPNLQVIPAYAKYLADAGIPGVLVNGTSGEGTSMTIDERKLVAEKWAEACAQTKQHLMVQVGGAALPDVLALARHAEKIGAHSILCLPELFHKPATTSDLIRYLQVVARAAPNTPLLYYHIPIFTGVDIHMGKLLNEVGNKIPTFSGVKFSSTDLEEGMAAVNAHGKKYTVFLGYDMHMADGCAQGFNSAIATTLNFMPQHGQKILQAVKAGKIAESQAVQKELNDIFGIIIRNGNRVSALKEAMNLLTPIKVGPVREPLPPLAPAEIAQMKKELKI